MITLPLHSLQADARFFSLLDNLPFALTIYQCDGTVVSFNQRAEAFWDVNRETMIAQFNILTDPQSVGEGSRELFARVERGEVVETEPSHYDTTQSLAQHERDHALWLQATLFPIITDGLISHVGLIHRDVTAQMLQREAIALAQGKLDVQHALIQVIGSSVVQLWDGIVLLSLVGTIDSQRAEVIADHLLTAIVATSADVVIIDITGVPGVDLTIATYLVKTAQAVRLLGGNVILVGIQPQLARTLVQLGADLSGLKTLANLKAGIAWCGDGAHKQVTHGILMRYS